MVPEEMPVETPVVVPNPPLDVPPNKLLDVLPSADPAVLVPPPPLPS